MSRPSRLAPALVLAVLAGAVPARGGSISIGIAPRVTLEEGQLVVRVRINNGGDEAAHSVVPVLWFGQQRVRGPAKDRLEPKDVVEPTVSLPVGELGPGRWPYRLAVDYTDANQYPFQALHAGILTVGSPPPAKVAVQKIEAAPMTAEGELRLVVKNLAGTERRASVLAVVPEGIEATDPRREVTLGPWAAQTVTIPLLNRTALAGSRYPVFAIVEYDDDDVRQSVVAQGLLEVRAARSFVESWGTVLWVVAIGLGLLWIGVSIWWMLVGRGGRAERRS